MSTVLSINVDGQEILIEAETIYGSEETSADDVIERTAGSFERAKATIVAISKSLVTAINGVDEALTPDEFTLEFGIKFKVDGSVLVAAVSTEAALTIKMVYKHKVTD